MLDGNWRDVVDRGLVPIGRSLHRTGITADVVTIIGIAMAGAASVCIGLGEMRLGFLLLVLTGGPDALDGAVAKAAGASSARGAYFDSVADRLTDALLFGGVAWHLAEVRSDHMMMLPVAIMATALFISYQRAKAESLGYDAKGGLMERAERFIVLAFGLLFSGPVRQQLGALRNHLDVERRVIRVARLLTQLDEPHYDIPPHSDLFDVFLQLHQASANLHVHNAHEHLSNMR